MPPAGPTLLEFWLALKSGATSEEAARVPSAHASDSPGTGASGGMACQPGGASRAFAPDGGAGGSVSGFGFSSGSGSVSGSGSGGGGYGLRLILPDPASQERVRRIMRELCEQDEKRKKALRQNSRKSQ